ncbi:MAG: alpha/beta fold hydrolase [Acidobacteriota bacterium]|nr:alpha/beta fold hydrolase [Acidobacteriota bacterium]
MPALWAQPAIEGTWQGTLQAGGVPLRLGLHISRGASGLLSSTLDSIDQGAMGLPVKETTFSSRNLHLEMPNLKATYEGTLSDDGTEIAGTFTQGMPLPLTFRRVDKVEILKRPQNPKPPFPYDAVDVTYETKAGIRLAGTLTSPRGEGPFPAAILITGSGPQDRDETLFQHKPFWVIADYLTRRGIAVLRVDDRGVGKSTGQSTQATIDDMADDVLAGVDFLKSRKQIDARHIGVIGHSEGGIVGPAAAARSADIAFVVMLAGTGVDGEHILYLQAELANRAAGAGDDVIASNRKLQQMIFDAMRSEKDS